MEIKTKTNTCDGGGLSTTSFITSGDNWSSPERISIQEYSDRIEMIYKQVSMITLTIYPPPPSQARVFKIVFSCINGKWNKSQPIYGKIIPTQQEYYEFEE